MQCPVCPTTTLMMTNREGIEIDYCPKCRGVWLDRGELDKIIERSASQSAPVQSTEVRPDSRQAQGGHQYRGDDDDRKYDKQGHYDKYGKRKRSGLLGELFDFD